MHILRNNMKSIAEFLIFLCLISANVAETVRLGVPITKPTVFSFKEDIIDVDLGNQDYHVKLRGKSLLIFAKKKDSQPTTLFVRYGKDKTTYVAEIFPDDKAPLHRIIQTSGTVQHFREYSSQTSDNQLPNNVSVFAPNEKQQYAWFAVNEGGVIVMVSNIMHRGDQTYFRIYIENKTTVNLKLSQHIFEYITVLKKWIFFTNKQRNRVIPILTPAKLELAPMQFDYFDFSIPTYTSNGGLDIFLAESEDGVRKYEINIPSKILLQAPRK